jgi:hypothetical protein
MKFDDIFKPAGAAEGQTITSYYNLDDAQMMRKTMDLLNLCKTSEALDSVILDTGLALADTKEETAVLFYLMQKAVLSEVMQVSEESSQLLDFTRKAIEQMDAEAQEQYASSMVTQMLEAGMLDIENDEDDE